MRYMAKWWVSVAGAFLAGIVCIFIFYSPVEADSARTPGSADDPIVTKSYVDAKVASLVKAELDKLIGGGGGIGAGSGEKPSLEVVVVPQGQTMMVKAGGEIVVRTGSAVVVSSTVDGLADVTKGEDIAPGKPVERNHLLLVPRDGRGIQHAPESTADLIVLVRGEYELQ